MRKIVTLATVLTLSLAADPYTKQSRIQDMQTMATAMEQIQAGFFYNNVDLVQEGVYSLTDTIMRIEPPLEEAEEKNPMARYMNNKIQITNKIKKNIYNRGKIILERFRAGDPTQAAQAFSKILKKCMACHVQIRQW